MAAAAALQWRCRYHAHVLSAAVGPGQRHGGRPGNSPPQASEGDEGDWGEAFGERQFTQWEDGGEEDAWSDDGFAPLMPANGRGRKGAGDKGNNQNKPKKAPGKKGNGPVKIGALRCVQQARRARLRHRGAAPTLRDVPPSGGGHAGIIERFPRDTLIFPRLADWL